MEWRIENERNQTDSARPNAPHNFRALAGKAKDKRMKLSTPTKWERYWQHPTRQMCESHTLTSLRAASS